MKMTMEPQIILIVNEALWVGDRLQHSLLNPYQIQATSIQLCDDPTDDKHFFDIDTQHAQVSFKMHGLTCLFKIRMPTTWEIDNCPHVELTLDHEWDPNEDTFILDVESIESNAGPMIIGAYQ